MMNIRKAQTSDIDGLAELTRSLAHYYLSDGQSELPQWFAASLTDSAFAARLEDSDYFNFVADLNGVIVGYISLKTGFHLYHLFVSADYHNQGIGKQLWQYCLSNLKIERCTVRSSIFAVPVYSQFGFRMSGSASSKDGIGFQPMLYNGANVP